MEQEDDARQPAPAMPPWGHCFKRTGTDEPATIELTQLDVKLFRLQSSLTYIGPSSVNAPREVGPTSLPTTDLTSVPGPMRWFVSPYGLHTPAALLHDRLVGEEAPEGFQRADADRLFRDMLDALGVPLLRRYLMWAAVAYGTRWSAGGPRRIGIVAWSVLAAFGMAALAIGLATWSLPWLAVAVVLPFPAAALWGKQYGGGVLAAGSGPWLALPALIAALGYGIYWLLESTLQLLPITPERRDPAPPEGLLTPQAGSSSRTDGGQDRRPCPPSNPSSSSNATTPSPSSASTARPPATR